MIWNYIGREREMQIWERILRVKRFVRFVRKRERDTSMEEEVFE